MIYSISFINEGNQQSIINTDRQKERIVGTIFYLVVMILNDLCSSGTVYQQSCYFIKKDRFSLLCSICNKRPVSFALSWHSAGLEYGHNALETVFSSTPSSFDSRKTQWHRAVLLWVPLINLNCQTLLVKGKWDIKEKKKDQGKKAAVTFSAVLSWCSVFHTSLAVHIALNRKNGCPAYSMASFGYSFVWNCCHGFWGRLKSGIKIHP